MLFLAVSACSFEPPADVGDDDTPGDDGGGDDSDGGPDGSVDRAARLFIATICCVDPSGIYLASVDDGAPTTPTPVTPVGKISAADVSADGSAILYATDEATPGVSLLYHVRVDGSGAGSPGVASADHGGGANHGRFGTWLARDGSHLVYAWGSIAKGGFLTIDQYYFVDLSGAEPGDPVPLTGGAAPTGGQMSPDGRKFVYVENHGVYLVDISGTTPSAPVTLSAPNAQAEISFVQFSPTSAKVSFVADLTTNGVNELYIVDISGATPGAVERASATLATGEDVMAPDPFYSLGTPPAFTPDGNKLAYLVTDSNGAAKALFVVDVSGAAPGTAHRANDVPVAGGAFEIGFFSGPTFVITDNAHLVYRIDQRFDDVYEVFRVDISGALPGPTQRISGALVSGGDVSTMTAARDGSGLAYVADQQTDDVGEVFYVDLRGAQPAAPVPVNDALVAEGDAGFPAFAPDSQTLVYIADAETDAESHIYLADVSTSTPGTPQKVSTTALGSTSLFAPTYAPDSSALYWVEGYGTGSANVLVAGLQGAVASAPVEIDVPGGVATFWVR